MLELYNIKNFLENMQLEIENTKDKILLLELDLQELEKDTTVELDEKRKKIHGRIIQRDIYNKSKKLNELYDNIKSVEEEAEFLIRLFHNLNSVEEMREWDNIDVQKEYFNAQLSIEFNVKLMTNSNLDTELVKTIFAMPDDSSIKQKAIGFIASKNKNLSNKESV
jgi:hypothetical protein